MAALGLVSERLADVVQQRAAHRHRRVEPDLLGHHPGQVRGLQQVFQHVLPVRRAVAQLTEEGDQLGCEVGDAHLDHGVLACSQAAAVDLVGRAGAGLLDPARVDPAVSDEVLQRHPGDLATYWVEAAQRH
jgi:hypothetical protein